MKIVYLILLAYILNASSIEFTQEEKSFIQNHPTIKVGIDIRVHTIDAIDISGNHVGVSEDYLQIISKKSGIKFDLVTSENFKMTLKSLEEKKIDMISSIFNIGEVSKKLIFTDPYISVQFYTYSRGDERTILNLNQLSGSKVCVLKGFMVEDWLKRNYPSIRVVGVNTIYDGLEQVYRNRASVFINDFTSTNYVLDAMFLPNMKLNAPIAQLSNVPVSMAIRPDYKLLQTIVNKINANLSEEEIKNIKEKWFNKSKISMLNFSKSEGY